MVRLTILTMVLTWAITFPLMTTWLYAHAEGRGLAWFRKPRPSVPTLGMLDMAPKPLTRAEFAAVKR